MAGFLDIKRLRYFRAIAEHGSLSAAARALNLAQPALSHHVRELEAEIGVPVLERHRDGVRLTASGQLLLRHALDITGRVDRAELELSGFARRETARVKIRLVVISSLAADLAPLVVADLARELPEVVLRVTEAGSRGSRDLLERGEADLAIHLAEDGHGSEAPLAVERLHFVTAGSGAGAPPITFAEVAAQRLVMPALGNPLRSLVEEAAARTGMTLDVAHEIDGSEPRRNAVLSGLGATIFGAHSVHGAERQVGLTARPIIEPTLFRPIFLGVRRGLDPALVLRLRAVLARSVAGFGGIEMAAR